MLPAYNGCDILQKNRPQNFGDWSLRRPNGTCLIGVNHNLNSPKNVTIWYLKTTICFTMTQTKGRKRIRLSRLIYYCWGVDFPVIATQQPNKALQGYSRTNSHYEERPFSRLVKTQNQLRGHQAKYSTFIYIQVYWHVLFGFF